MARKRKAGDGTVRQRKDGRWEGRIVIGYDDNGYPKTKSVLAKTKKECGGLKPEKAREMQVLTREELQRFLIQAKFEGYYEVFLLDLATGLRRGELMALQWDDLNFKTGVLDVNKQVYDVRGQLQISTPKTKNSVRKIVLPPAVVEGLREYKKTVDSRWMFPSPVKEDCPITPGVVRRRLQLILKHAGCKHVIRQQSNDLFVLLDLMLRRRITAGHDDKLLETGFSKREAEQSMFVHGKEILRLRRRQLQHHVNGFYLLRNCPFSAVTDDVVGNLQQSAHLHLPHTGIGHAHGVVNR